MLLACFADVRADVMFFFFFLHSSLATNDVVKFKLRRMDPEQRISNMCNNFIHLLVVQNADSSCNDRHFFLSRVRYLLLACLLASCWLLHVAVVRSCVQGCVSSFYGVCHHFLRA